MASDKLTKSAINALESREKMYRVFDGGGLFVQVEPNGGRYWRMAYRFNGKPKTLSFGKWPEVDLRTAREKRQAAKVELRAGRDPGATAKSGLRFDGVTFGEIAAKYLADMETEGRAPATIAKNRWLLEDLAAPLKDAPMAALEEDAPKIQALCEAVKGDKGRSNKEGRYESAIRLRGAIGGVFRYAIRTGRAKIDPTVALAGGIKRPPATHHAAITDRPRFVDGKRKAVGRLLAAIDNFNGARTVALALKLAPYLAVRPGELRAMEWEELDRRRERAWIIPAHKAKMRREHVVPLAPQALALLEELHKLNKDSVFVFPNSRTPSKCMSEGTMAAGLASIGYGPAQHTPHGWRSVFSTLANASRKFEPDVIEAQLAHVKADKVSAAYDRNEYPEERIALMAWWANELDRMRKNARSLARIEG
jgi:integrase